MTMAATLLSICDPNSSPSSRNRISGALRSPPRVGQKIHTFQSRRNRSHFRGQKRRRRLLVVAVTEGSAKKPADSEEAIPAWARADSEEPPPWARGEAGENPSSPSFEIPFFAYLLASAITAIASVGSVFEYLNKNPAFGIVNSDSNFYAPLLGFFAVTGIPTTVFLWLKSVEAANKQAEEQDKRDGYF